MKENLEQLLLLWIFFLLTVISMFFCVNMLLAFVKLNNDFLFSVFYFLSFGGVFIFANKVYIKFSRKIKYASLLLPPLITIFLFFLFSLT